MARKFLIVATNTRNGQKEVVHEFDFTFHLGDSYESAFAEALTKELKSIFPDRIPLDCKDFVLCEIKQKLLPLALLALLKK